MACIRGGAMGGYKITVIFLTIYVLLFTAIEVKAKKNSDVPFFMKGMYSVERYCQYLEISGAGARCQNENKSYQYPREEIVYISFFHGGEVYKLKNIGEKEIRLINRLAKNKEQDTEKKNKDQPSKRESHLLSKPIIDTSTSFVNDSNSSAYDFQGIRLGTPLNPKNRFKYRKKDIIDSKFVCCKSSYCPDKETYNVSIYPSSSDPNMGVVTCKWAIKGKGGEKRFQQVLDGMDSKYKWRGTDIRVGNGYSKFYTYKFIPPPDSAEPRLFEISISFHRVLYNEIAKGLTFKFGKPSVVHNNEVQNKMGASFSDTILLWENEESQISLKERFTDINTSLLMYELKKLSSYYYDSQQDKNIKKAVNNL